MKDFQLTGNCVSYRCTIPTCPKYQQDVHLIAKDEVLASLFTLMQDLHVTKDVRGESLRLAFGVLWDWFEPGIDRNSAAFLDAASFWEATKNLRQNLNTGVQMLNYVAVVKPPAASSLS